MRPKGYQFDMPDIRNKVNANSHKHRIEKNLPIMVDAYVD